MSLAYQRTVLGALQQNELALVEGRAAVGGDLVQIYRTLGGAWTRGPPWPVT